MRQKCKYNKKRDVGTVLEGLCPDKNAMIESHTIPATMSDVVYNELSNIEHVGSRIDDDFDAIQVSRYLHDLSTQERQDVAPTSE